MKELSIEEKAKCYDEAIDKVAHFIKKHIGFGCMINPNSSEAKELFNIFPELKESEDERIRNWLIETIKRVPNDSIEWETIDKSSILAWLEKQGEQKSDEWSDEQMEALESAPEKLYIDSREHWMKSWTAFTTKAKGDDIEYTRTDAFIEKATKYIANHFLAPGMDNEIKDFENYMKGE